MTSTHPASARARRTAVVLHLVCRLTRLRPPSWTGGAPDATGATGAPRPVGETLAYGRYRGVPFRVWTDHQPGGASLVAASGHPPFGASARALIIRRARDAAPDVERDATALGIDADPAPLLDAAPEAGAVLADDARRDAAVRAFLCTPVPTGRSR